MAFKRPRTRGTDSATPSPTSTPRQRSSARLATAGMTSNRRKQPQTGPGQSPQDPIRVEEPLYSHISEEDADTIREKIDISHWFESDANFQSFFHSYGPHHCIPPHWMNCQYFSDEGFQFQKLVEEQELVTFVSLKNNYSPDLVKAFLFSLERGKNGSLVSTVVHQRIEITPEAWLQVAGLQYQGVQVKPKNPDSLAFYDRHAALAPYLKEPMAHVPRKPPIGLLTYEGRLLHFAIVKNIYPRKGNYAILLEEDILLMFCLRKNKLNWPWLFSERLLKCKSKPKGDIPYGILISAFLDFFGVDTLSTRHPVIIEFDPSHLASMKIKKINGIWCYKGCPIMRTNEEPDDLNAELDVADAVYRSTSAHQDASTGSAAATSFSDPFQQFLIQQFNSLNLRVDQHFSSLNQKVDNMRVDMTQGFQSLELRFDSVSREMNFLNTRVDGLDARVDSALVDSDDDGTADF